MRSLVRWLLLVLCAAFGCAADPWLRPERVDGRTEVVVVGNLHRRHLHDEDFPLDLVREQVRRAAPDVLLAEIPPALFSEVRAIVEGEASAPSPASAWLYSFPELAEVVFPLARELGVEVVPVSGFTPEYARDLRAYRATHAVPADHHALCAEAHVTRRDDEEGLDPEWLASPSYARLHAWRDRCLQTHAAEGMGEAAPRRRDARHVARVLEAVAAHPGRRIVVVFDARRRWALEHALRERPEVEVLDPRAFLDD